MIPPNQAMSNYVNINKALQSFTSTINVAIENSVPFQKLKVSKQNLPQNIKNFDKQRSQHCRQWIRYRFTGDLKKVKDQ